MSSDPENLRALHCPICGGTAFAKLGSVSYSLNRVMENIVVACECCHHVMVDTTTMSAAHLAALYAAPEPEQVWSRDGATPYEEIVEAVLPFLMRALAQPAPMIADFGYGHGHILRSLCEVYGVPAEQLLGYDFQPLTLSGIDSMALDLNGIDENDTGGAQPYDFAFCTHLLEHIPDPRRLLRALRRLARPNAHLYLETPDHALLNREILQNSNQTCAQHLHYFTADRLAALAVSCGWTVVWSQVSQFGFVPRARVLLARDGLSDARIPTVQFLDYARRLRQQAAQVLLDASEAEAAAVWGCGTDFQVMATENNAILDRIGTGFIKLFDRSLAGSTLFGASIESPDGLAAFPGPVILTPRPAISRQTMHDAAMGMGISERVVDPYS